MKIEVIYNNPRRGELYKSIEALEDFLKKDIFQRGIEKIKITNLEIYSERDKLTFIEMLYGHKFNR